ncbi:MAG: methylated-DNA--[protein]-cysteine S-methyltransferase, partial [Phycisphaerales bacterium]
AERGELARHFGCEWREGTSDLLEMVAAQLEGYFSGARTTFDIPTNAPGTPNQRHVWAQLRRIPFGETITYAALARRVGNPRASRAVGGANGRNRIAIVTPCHRVVSSGGLGGYAGGLDRKRQLLAHERDMRSSIFVEHAQSLA